MKYRYYYKHFPGQGYAGFVNGKRFTSFYDERDLNELKILLQKEEQKRKAEQIQQPTSFREYLIKHGDPEFVKDYLEYVAKKGL
jgi:hypothetical protein